jgi:hypothetical protein
MPVGCKEIASTKITTAQDEDPFRVRAYLPGEAHAPGAAKRCRINADNEKSPAAGEISRHIRA